MKKTILIVLCFSISFITYSQDILTKKNGEDIKVKVTEVNQVDIKFKKSENLTGPTYIISKADVFMIRYEDGSKDIFNEISNTSDMDSRGKEDAIMNYKGRNSGAIGTAFTVMFTSPLIGLIPALACSSTEPSDENLRYTNRELMRNADYNRAYTEQAHKIKRRKIWSAFGIGSAAWLVLVLLLSSGG